VRDDDIEVEWYDGDDIDPRHNTLEVGLQTWCCEHTKENLDREETDADRLDNINCVRLIRRSRLELYKRGCVRVRVSE